MIRSSLLVLLLAGHVSAAGPVAPEEVLRHLDALRPELVSMNQDVWTYAELGLEEFRSAARLAGVLKKAGFKVREGVSNAARHSGAGHVTVTLDVTEDVVVEIVDDGRGIDPRAARSGLRNLEQRACRHGGEAAVEPLPDGGTRLRWSARLR